MKHGNEAHTFHLTMTERRLVVCGRCAFDFDVFHLVSDGQQFPVDVPGVVASARVHSETFFEPPKAFVWKNRLAGSGNQEVSSQARQQETCTFFSGLFCFHVRCVNLLMAHAMNHLSEFSCNVSILEFCLITHGLSLLFSENVIGASILFVLRVVVGRSVGRAVQCLSPRALLHQTAHLGPSRRHHRSSAAPTAMAATPSAVVASAPALSYSSSLPTTSAAPCSCHGCGTSGNSRTTRQLQRRGQPLPQPGSLTMYAQCSCASTV